MNLYRKSFSAAQIKRSFQLLVGRKEEDQTHKEEKDEEENDKAEYWSEAR